MADDKLFDLAKKDKETETIKTHLEKLGQILGEGLEEEEMSTKMMNYIDSIPKDEARLVEEYFELDKEKETPELSEVSKLIIDAGLPPTDEERDILIKQQQIQEQELKRKDLLLNPRSKEELEEAVKDNRFFGTIEKPQTKLIMNKISGKEEEMSRKEYIQYTDKLREKNLEDIRKKRTRGEL